MLPTLLKVAHGSTDTYVEPFCGSAALYFGLKPKKAYLYDLNRHLIQVLLAVQREPEDVHKRYAAFQPDKDTYLAVRSSYNRHDYSGNDKAAAFIYLNRHCFNGLWRTNKSGMFNVPFGGASSSPPTVCFFQKCSEVLKNAHIECYDFRESLSKHHGGGKLFFVDPPYSLEGTRLFQEYGPDVFTRKCLFDLEAQLRRLDSEGAKIILLYCDDPDVRVAFSDWKISSATVTRNVGGFKDRRKLATEVMVTNFSWN